MSTLHVNHAEADVDSDALTDGNWLELVLEIASSAADAESSILESLKGICVC